ncbi:MAG: CPBP family intramembrane metalloprotease [Candidatus Bathyarchaeota archaeon]|nr:MAG: CPBP family intramembrane metalloprotease [Candidatus Bathyarchaeota archaeon]
MALPTPIEVIINILVVIIGIPIVYLLSNALKLRPKSLVIEHPRRELTLVFLVIIALSAMISVRSVTYKLPPWLQVDAIDLLWVAVYYTTLFIPVIIAMKRTGQNLRSIGISSEDKWRMFALGLIFSAIYITITGIVAPSIGVKFMGFSTSQAYGLIFFAIVGFGEETIWRGYIQTRLIAYAGTLKGYVIASLLFALWHFPIYYHGVVLETLASTFLVLVPSLLMGYIMLRSQNIIPSSIFHLFWDWNNMLLWQLIRLP